MKQSRPTTSRTLIDYATGLVSRAEAEFLLMSLLPATRAEVYSERPVSAALVRRFHRALHAVRQNQPPQYAVHSAPFLDLDLYVDRRVLIPRPETEGLVELSLQYCPRPRLVIDYGTGSGCIAIAVVRAVPGCRVVAVDSSRSALTVARLNARRYRVLRRIRFLCCSRPSAQQLSRLTGQADLLISNPPYIPSRRIDRLGPRLSHEPRAALDGGPDGTSILAMIFAEGPQLLRRGGWLVTELDPAVGRLVKRRWPTIELKPDLSGRIRYGLLQKQ